MRYAVVVGLARRVGTDRSTLDDRFRGWVRSAVSSWGAGAQAARVVGRTRGWFTKYLQGKGQLDLDGTVALAAWLGVSLDEWIRSETHVPPLTDYERRLIEVCGSLSLPMRQAVLELAERLSGTLPHDAAPAPRPKRRAARRGTRKDMPGIRPKE